MAQYTLGNICDEYLQEKGLPDNSWNRCYANGVSFLRRANLSTSGIPKVVQLVIDDADRCALPTDYIQYTKIALMMNGRLFSLALNSNLAIQPVFNNCGEPVINQTSYLQNPNISIGLGYVGTPFMVGDTQRNGEFIGRLFGVGSDNNPYGYYRIDKEMGQIVFSGLVQTTDIIMEYIADINSINNDFVVHPYCIEALKAWIEWKLGKADKQHYLTEAKIMRLNFGSFNINEWEQAAQSNNMGAPKV